MCFTRSHYDRAGQSLYYDVTYPYFETSTTLPLDYVTQINKEPSAINIYYAAPGWLQFSCAFNQGS
jgi:hypothetical protein